MITAERIKQLKGIIQEMETALEEKAQLEAKKQFTVVYSFGGGPPVPAPDTFKDSLLKELTATNTKKLTDLEKQFGNPTNDASAYQ